MGYQPPRQVVFPLTLPCFMDIAQCCPIYCRWFDFRVAKSNSSVPQPWMSIVSNHAVGGCCSVCHRLTPSADGNTLACMCTIVQLSFSVP